MGLRSVMSKNTIITIISPIAVLEQGECKQDLKIDLEFLGM